MRVLTNDAGATVAVISGAILQGTSLPVGVQDGDLWIDTDDKILYSYSGGVSTALGSFQ